MKEFMKALLFAIFVAIIVRVVFLFSNQLWKFLIELNQMGAQEILIASSGF